jgi:hypothetical protein
MHPMDLTPPEGSGISIDYESGDPTIVVPAKRSVSRYFGGVFLLFWLCGWAFGFVAVSSQVLTGKANLFAVVWLGGWTIGGIFAALSAYRIFRPAVPERLQIKRGSVGYDSGIPPLEFNTYQRKSAREYWNSLLSKRIRADLNRAELQTLRLRETEAGNRLTVDLGSRRIDLASQAGEVEREWLARLLATRYGLTQAISGTVAEDSGVPHVTSR